MTRFSPLLLIAFALGCSGESRPLPPKEVTGTSSLKDLQQGTAQNAVAAGAKLGQQQLTQTTITAVPPEPVTPATPSAPVVVVKPVAPVVKIEVAARETERPAAPLIRLSGIRSDKPHPTRDKALTDAIQVAQYRIQEQLLQLDPPVHAKPSLATIRNEYLKTNSVKEDFPSEADKANWRASKLDPNREWVTIDVEVTEAQVQRLRAGDRVEDAFRVMGLVFVIIAALYGFLRLDAFTKGYLTGWLALAAAVVVGIVLLFVLRSQGFAPTITP